MSTKIVSTGTQLLSRTLSLCPWRLQHSCWWTGKTSEWCPWSHSSGWRRNTANKFLRKNTNGPNNNKNNQCSGSTTLQDYIWFQKRDLEFCQDFDPDSRDLKSCLIRLLDTVHSQVWIQILNNSFSEKSFLNLKNLFKNLFYFY